MCKRAAVLVNLQWHLMNVDNTTEYTTSDRLKINPEDTLITFQCSDLIRDLSKTIPNNEHLPNIIDIECLDRQMSQKRREYSENRNWQIISSLREHEIIDSDFKIKSENIQVFMEKFCKLYTKLFNKSHEEQDRFKNIESNINSIIYERQVLGIRIDYQIAINKCEELENEIYRIKNELQIHYGIFDPDNESQQRSYLKSKGYNIVQSLLYTFKIWRKEDSVCGYFYEIIRNTQDLDSILYLLSHWGSSQKTFPSYFGFGTITSRITVRQPSIQNLRKKNRNVIIPDEGYRFLYIDYSQFEAGILACLSDDNELLSLYEKDIYSDLANQALLDVTRRSEAKVIFYRYIYGDSTLEPKYINYFNKFNKLKEYKKSIEEKANREGKIGSKKGNYRVCIEENNSWALSHDIQANASLIYKNAVIRTRAEVDSAEFLVPMHDGTLYQIKELKYEESKNIICEIYKSEFKNMFPKINPKVNYSESFDNSEE